MKSILIYLLRWLKHRSHPIRSNSYWAGNLVAWLLEQAELAKRREVVQ